MEQTFLFELSRLNPVASSSYFIMSTLFNMLVVWLSAGGLGGGKQRHTSHDQSLHRHDQARAVLPRRDRCVFTRKTGFQPGCSSDCKIFDFGGIRGWDTSKSKTDWFNVKQGLGRHRMGLRSSTARTTRASLLVRVGVALIVLLVGILLIGLIQVSGISLRVAMPVLLLVPGVILLGMSRFSRSDK